MVCSEDFRITDSEIAGLPFDLEDFRITDSDFWESTLARISGG